MGFGYPSTLQHESFWVRVTGTGVPKIQSFKGLRMCSLGIGASLGVGLQASFFMTTLVSVAGIMHGCFGITWAHQRSFNDAFAVLQAFTVKAFYRASMSKITNFF